MIVQNWAFLWWDGRNNRVKLGIHLQKKNKCLFKSGLTAFHFIMIFIGKQILADFNLRNRAFG